MSPSTSIRSHVEERYTGAARERENALCCPVDYDARLLEAIPAEVIEKDYGCGDPSKWLRPGDTVLDLGSGTGKIAFIASQVVGPEGRVIGVDMTDEMLGVARRNAPFVAERIGYANVEFRKGRIEDLALDLERMGEALAASPVADENAYLAMDDTAAALRAKHPMIPAGSVDAVVSNCVLNLVDPADKPRLFQEIFRVLKNGGRAVISDIVSDEPVPEELRNDPDLWSGCVSGALSESAFLRAFEDAGFHGVEILRLETKPWRTVQGIEFRSVTVRAYKGKLGPCRDHLQAVIYKGPFKEARDDDGHVFHRGERTAVCDKTFRLLRSGPYAGDFVFLEPREPVEPQDAKPFACGPAARRHPRETKGHDFNATTEASVCTDSGCC